MSRRFGPEGRLSRLVAGWRSAVRCGPALPSAATTEPVKTASTFYTSAKVAAARHNVAT